MKSRSAGWILGAMLLMLPWTAWAAPNAPATSRGHILHVSDIHFEPLSDPSLRRALETRPVEKWADILGKSAGQAGPGTPGTNYALLRRFLHDARRRSTYDFVVNTGDGLAHSFRQDFDKAGGKPEDYAAFAAKTLRFLDLEIGRTLEVPVISALGNNDSECGDYHSLPGDPVQKGLAASLPILRADPDARASFSTSGSYVVRNPKVPSQDVVVVNDVYWSDAYWSDHYANACPSAKPGAPGARELDWLAGRLSDAARAGHKVLLVMHIPPGIDDHQSEPRTCTDGGVAMMASAYGPPLMDLLVRNSAVIKLVLAGHSHREDFRAFGPSDAPVGVRTAAALSPVFGNRPTYSILDYDRRTGAFEDFRSVALFDGGAPAWRQTYEFRQAYGAQRVDGRAFRTAADLIKADAGIRGRYLALYAAGAEPIKDADWRVYACGQTSESLEAFRACRCPPGT